VFQTIFKLICLGEKFETKIDDLICVDWENQDVQENWLRTDIDFICNLHTQVHSDFNYLLEEEKENQNDFVNMFKKYIASLLNKLIEHLPFTDEVIKIVDLIELKDKHLEIERKLRDFNKLFQIVNDDEMKNQVLPQLLRLKEIGIEYSQRNEKDTSFDIWKRVIDSGKYPSLVKFVKFIQVLPTSSSDIEQAFSIIKLFRTNQRNRLSAKSLEGLILIHQEYQGEKNIILPKNLLNLFSEMKDELNQRKNEKEGKVLPMRRHHSELPPVEEEKNNQMIIEDQRNTLMTKKPKYSKEDFDKNEKFEDIGNLDEIEEESNPKKVTKGNLVKEINPLKDKITQKDSSLV